MKRDEETEDRLRKILKGAFSGSPTPLKDVPTRNGKRRKISASSASRANAKNARPAT
jgi:hypothetical protein